MLDPKGIASVVLLAALTKCGSEDRVSFSPQTGARRAAVGAADAGPATPDPETGDPATADDLCPAPAIAASTLSTNYIIGWSTPSDQGTIRTAIGNGDCGTWTGSPHSDNSNVKTRHHFAIAYGGGVVLLVWRQQGTRTEIDRNIRYRWYSSGAWSSTIGGPLSTNIDVWGSPAAAYHGATGRFVVGWVNAPGGNSDPAPWSDHAFMRFRTGTFSGSTWTWSGASEVWGSDEDLDGAKEAGEYWTYPWDSFDIECHSSLDHCPVVFVDGTNARPLRRIYVQVESDGTVHYMPGTYETVDSLAYVASPGVAHRSCSLLCGGCGGSAIFLRAAGLRSANGYDPYNYPPYKLWKHPCFGSTWDAPTVWGSGSWDAPAYVFHEVQQAWRFTYLGAFY